MAEDRREALKILGTIGATCAYPFSADELYGQHAGHSAAAGGQAALPPGPHFFKKEEMETIVRLADLIIPKTDTPGAVEAGVPAYIDFVVGQNKQAQSVFRRGLRWLDDKAGGRFLSLGEAEQVAILEPLAGAADAIVDPPAGSLRRRTKKLSAEIAFFRAMKSLTADGYYTSRVGLIEELGYKGNTVLAAFPECVHEH
jgi:hypothetical protein